MKRNVLHSTMILAFLILLVTMITSIAQAQDDRQNDRRSDRRTLIGEDRGVQDRISDRRTYREDRDGDHDGKRGRGFWDKLTEEQALELRTLIGTMKNNGATREEIRDAVKAQLTEWGIDPNDRDGKRERLSEETGSVRYLQNAPNPFNPSTTISYALTADEHVTLRVYSIQRQLIVTLLDVPQSIGGYSISWDGRYAMGSRIASGTYIYQVTAGDQVISNQMLLTK